MAGRAGKIGGAYSVAVTHGPGERRKIAVSEYGLGENLSGGFQQFHQFLAAGTQRGGVGLDQVTRFLEAENERRLGHGSHAGDDTTERGAK